MTSEVPDLPYDEAMAKKQKDESVKKMNDALVLTGNVAALVGKYHIELMAQGIPQDAAIELSKQYAREILERLNW